MSVTLKKSVGFFMACCLDYKCPQEREYVTITVVSASPCYKSQAAFIGLRRDGLESHNVKGHLRWMYSRLSSVWSYNQDHFSLGKLLFFSCEVGYKFKPHIIRC